MNTLNLQDHKSNIHKSAVFLNANNGLAERKQDNNRIYNCKKHNKILRNKFNQGGE